ncbi:unnamed protein product [Anisakis simplex]|uniref:Secreted protein n=1 Tax=Anisakis simplex TaxID=6269 RepID=A0A0M3JJL4_ANISI|nr:unnamed protein product [Anisakis simplex]
MMSTSVGATRLACVSSCGLTKVCPVQDASCPQDVACSGGAKVDSFPQYRMMGIPCMQFCILHPSFSATSLAYLTVVNLTSAVVQS